LNKENKYDEDTILVKAELNRCCKQFNKRTRKCECHCDKSKIGICHEFPLHPDHQIICSDDCGYSFFWVEVEMPDLI